MEGDDKTQQLQCGECVFCVHLPHRTGPSALIGRVQSLLSLPQMDPTNVGVTDTKVHGREGEGEKEERKKE